MQFPIVVIHSVTGDEKRQGVILGRPRPLSFLTIVFVVTKELKTALRCWVGLPRPLGKTALLMSNLN